MFSLFSKAKNLIKNISQNNGVKNNLNITEGEQFVSLLKKIGTTMLGVLSFLSSPFVSIIMLFLPIIVVFMIVLNLLMSLSMIPDIIWGVGSNSNSITNYTDYLQWAIDIANDDSHGYSQCARTGPDYDCSSLVYYSLLNSGYSEGQLGGSYPFTTYTMDAILTNIGFERHSYNETELQAGDILWRSSHTGIYAGNGQVVQASSSRQGNGLCGTTGDQDGTEIWISGNLGNWTAFYRKSS